MGGPCTVDGQVHHELDNFHQCQVQLDGESWPSSEHCYQGSKFPKGSEHREAIRTASTGFDSFKLGQMNSAQLRSDLEEAKVEMMYQANFAKFSQNCHLRTLLVNSRGHIEAQGDVGMWKTWNEVILERIREELRDYEVRDNCALSRCMDAMAAYEAAAKAKDEYALRVATQYAAKRKQIPKLSDNAIAAAVVRGAGQELDGQYEADLLVPEANGQPHFRRQEGGHLYLGNKNGRLAWVLDEVFSAGEATGTAYISVTADTSLPQGQHTWLCYNGSIHVNSIVTIEAR